MVHQLKTSAQALTGELSKHVVALQRRQQAVLCYAAAQRKSANADTKSKPFAPTSN